MRKLTESQLLRLACLYAEQDRESFIEAWSHCPNEEACVEAKQFLEQLKAYRLKRWGKSLQEQIAESPVSPVNVH